MKHLPYYIILGAIIISLTIVFVPWASATHGGIHIVTCGTSFSGGTEFDEITEQDVTVPGNFCTLCDLFPMFDNMLKFVWLYITVPVATIMLVYGGFLMLIPTFGADGSAAMYTKGKKVLTRTIAGIAIVFFAWLAIDTIIKLLGGKIVAGDRQFISQGFGPWNEVNCTATQLGNPSATFIGPIDTATTIDGFDVTSPEAQALLASEEGIAWKNTEGFDVCTLASLAPYSSIINEAAAQFGISSARIQAIIFAESSGRAGAERADRVGTSYGLMQILPATARTIDTALKGLTDSQVAEKLKDPNYNIRLGTQYYLQLLQKYSGNKQLASGAYNGGPKANNTSSNCPGRNPDGTPVRWWQCQWDSDGCFGTTDTSCAPNTGYAVTRTYVPRIDSIEAKINGNRCE